MTFSKDCFRRRKFDGLKNLLHILLLVLFAAPGICQDFPGPREDSIQPRKQEVQVATNSTRKWIVGGSSVALYGGSLFLLNQAWYKQYPKTSFHTFDDAGEWLQMDKVGHSWSVYNASRATTAAWQWAGASHKKAVLLGSISGFSYLTVIEILDGHSANWGWSWADMAANFAGSSLFAGQELLWREQRIQLKFSAHRSRYAPMLQQRANDLYGSNLAESILKDYNGQTHWASFNLRSFFPAGNLPPWLSISIGYGVDGLFGGFENLARDKAGNITFDRRDLPRTRQWYLSPDVDLTKIRTKSKFLKTTFSVLNSVKVPAPAIRLSQNKISGRWLHF